MSKHQPVSPEEIERYRFPDPWVREIEAHRTALGLVRNRYRILDWGCGRGHAVAWLRAGGGYDAWGVEPDSEPLAHAETLLAGRGARHVVRLLGLDGTAPWEAASFHCVITQNVFEHVRDLGATVGEIARLTARSGLGLHRYPADLRIMEGHLRLPFLHWLPAGPIRRGALGLALALGGGPRWPELEPLSLRERVNRYHEYTAQKTFYRKPSTVMNAFRTSGFDVETRSLAFNQALARRRVLRVVANQAPALAELVLCRIATVQLRVVKNRNT